SSILTRWQRARQRIRDAEGLLRRALLAGAEALLPHLPPMLRGAVAARPPAPQSATAKVRAPLIRLTEPASEDPSPCRAGGLRKPSIDDPYGFACVSAAREFERYARIVQTIMAPAHATLRLARILRRRAVRKTSETTYPLWCDRWFPRPFTHADREPSRPAPSPIPAQRGASP
ncbi:MAG: hypothetical protein AAF253_12570, partial [Pseudomonadota bacterium]